MVIKRRPKRRFTPLLLAGSVLTLIGLLKLLQSGRWASEAGSAGGGGGNAGGGTGAGAGSTASSGGGAGSWSGSQAAAAPVRSACADTCEGFARNGVCDEGRPRPDAPPEEQPDGMSVFLVSCDLGTDCSDCGPWVHSNTRESDSWRPAADIRAKKFELLTRQVMAPTRHFVAFTDPSKDTDVSASLKNNALFEPGYTGIWHHILKEGCQGPGRERRLVLDVGANFGYYSLLAAAMGCRVRAWEPVPYFAAYLKYALLRNNLTHALRDTIVTNTSGADLSIVVPNRGYWGTAGIGGANIDRAIPNEGDYDSVARKTERLDEAVKEDVLILKVDVEGFEPSVLHGAKGLLLRHSVQHILMEYSPGVAERASDWRWHEDHPTVLLGLLHGGYSILHMASISEDWPDWTRKRATRAMGQASAKSKERAPGVTAEVLQHDLHDSWRLQDGSLGCLGEGVSLEGLPPTGAHLFGCGGLPEGLDPQSFRSFFGHNTNIWAFKGEKPSWATAGGVAALVPPDYDIRHRFFVPGGVVGSGHRLCKDVAPTAQVAHRCPCIDAAVCGELERRVTDLAAAGQLPPFPVKGRSAAEHKLRIEAW